MLLTAITGSIKVACSKFFSSYKLLKLFAMDKLILDFKAQDTPYKEFVLAFSWAVYTFEQYLRYFYLFMIDLLFTYFGPYSFFNIKAFVSIVNFVNHIHQSPYRILKKFERNFEKHKNMVLTKRNLSLFRLCLDRFKARV